MACRAIHCWTFNGLVGAFLDLALAYFILCGAGFAFLANKFLGLFGLQLPCPCGGLFGRPNGQCLHRLLVDYPPRMISSVQMSARSRFPFDAICAEEEVNRGQFDVKFVRDGDHSNRLLEMAREEAESCGSVSNFHAVGSQDWNSGGGPSSVNKGDWPETMHSPWRPRGGEDVKGKGVLSSLKPRLGLRRRRRAGGEQRKSSSIVPCGSQLDWQGVHRSCHGMGEQNQEISGNNSAVSNSGNHHDLSDNLKSPDNIAVVGGDTPSIGSGQHLAICKGTEKDLETGATKEYSSDINEVNAIKFLEQALKEEQTVRSALYLELERERSAAATAADEAMAMILRLQKEKASIEMEARQYQRMVEEKTAYDQEEMDILKEIIVRREREKHVLEKEVELYRQTLFSGERTMQQPLNELHDAIDMTGQKPNFSFEFADDPEFMLKEFSEPILKNETLNFGDGQMNNVPPTVGAGSNDIMISGCVSYEGDGGAHSADDKQDSLIRHGSERPSWGFVEESHSLKHSNERSEIFDEHHVKILDRSHGCHLDFQEKSMLTVDAYPSPQQNKTSRYEDGFSIHKLKKSHENDFHDEASISADKFGENGIENFGLFPCVDVDLESQQDTDEGDCRSYACQLQVEQSILDVHVIDDKSREEQKDKGRNFSTLCDASESSKTDDLRSGSDGSRKTDITRRHSRNSWLGAEQHVRRSRSDLTGSPLPVNTFYDSSSLSEFRRNSMSAVDKERMKLEMEVECLRERLKLVQQGREKLNFSLESMDKENLQLQLLEEISFQLREFRRLTGPPKAMRQVPLPPSKANSKKRRCRSAPLGFHGHT